MNLRIAFALALSLVTVGLVQQKVARAWASATATTRSLKLSVGKQTASFLMKSLLAPIAFASCGAFSSGVNPAGRDER